MRIINLILIMLFLSVGDISNAQITFNKVYDNDSLYDGALAIVETSSGYLLGAQTQDIFTGYFAAYLIQIDFNGDTLWTKQYDISNGADKILDICLLQDGYIICGTTKDVLGVKTDTYLT